MKTLFVDCIGHQFYFNLDVLSIKKIESRSGQVRRDDKNEIHLNNILFVCLSTVLHFPCMCGVISNVSSCMAFTGLGNRLRGPAYVFLIQKFLPVYLWEITQPPFLHRQTAPCRIPFKHREKSRLDK